MSNKNYYRNINSRYSTININKRLTKFLQKYNYLLIDHKNDNEDINKNKNFNTNITNIKFEIKKLKNILNNINTEIKEKNSYLEQSNNLLEHHKKINKNLKEELKKLINTNAGALGMYNDVTDIYKYVLIEYILIILGIIGVIYYTKK